MYTATVPRDAYKRYKATKSSEVIEYIDTDGFTLMKVTISLIQDCISCLFQFYGPRANYPNWWSRWILFWRFKMEF